MEILDTKVETCQHQDCIVHAYTITNQKEHSLDGNYDELHII